MPAIEAINSHFPFRMNIWANHQPGPADSRRRGMLALVFRQFGSGRSWLAASLFVVAVLSGGCRKPKPVAEGAEAAPMTSSVKPDPGPERPPPVVTPAQATAIQAVDLTPLREAIKKYQQQFKQNPYTLADLVHAGLMKRLPPLPPGTYIQYDRTTAAVKVVAQ
jgi:hypothetical protein